MVDGRSQKKQTSLEFETVGSFSRAYFFVEGSSDTSLLLRFFSALSSFVLLNLRLQDLCHLALFSERVLLIPLIPILILLL